MLQQALYQFMPEITFIEEQTYKILKKRDCYVLVSPHFFQAKERRLWPSVLCLLAALIAQGLNDKTLQMASILHRFNIGSFTHQSLSKHWDKASCQENKYAILFGDLVYSQVCHELTHKELEKYLLPMTVLIHTIHENLAQNEIENGENKWGKLELSVLSKISEFACFVGADTAGGTPYVIERMKECGYQLGILKAMWDNDEDISGNSDQWWKVWDCINSLPQGVGKELLSDLTLQMGRKWLLISPCFLKQEVHA